MDKKMQQNTVSETVWPWKNTDREASGPSGPTLVAGLLTLAVGLTICGVLYSRSHIVMAAIVGTISAGMFLAGRFMPRLYMVIEKGLSRFSRFVGRGVTGLLLVPFFFVFFGFGRMLQIVTGKDPMTRKLEPARDSYWQDKETNNDLERYKRQF